MLDWPHEFRIIGVSHFYLLLGFALGLVSLWGSSHLILILLETSPWGLFLCIEVLLLVFCIGIWRSSLGLCIGICDLSLSWGFDLLASCVHLLCEYYALGFGDSLLAFALGFGDTLGGCISWMKDPSLVLCIMCWRSSLDIMHWELEILLWLMHWDLWEYAYLEICDLFSWLLTLLLFLEVLLKGLFLCLLLRLLF